jgi:hypothetical protein
MRNNPTYDKAVSICEDAERHAASLTVGINDPDKEVYNEEAVKYLMDTLNMTPEQAIEYWDAFKRHKKKQLAALEKGSYTSFEQLNKKG